MCDIPFLPIFPICFQCGTDQNPCRCKVVGPTLGIWFLHILDFYISMLIVTSSGFICTVVAAVRISISQLLPWLELNWQLTAAFLQVICYPASIFCGCCLTQTGKEYVFHSFNSFFLSCLLRILTSLLVSLGIRSKSMGLWATQYPSSILVIW